MDETKELALLAKFDELAGEMGSANKAAQRIGIPASTISQLKKVHTPVTKKHSLLSLPHILTRKPKVLKPTVKSNTHLQAYRRRSIRLSRPAR